MAENKKHKREAKERRGVIGSGIKYRRVAMRKLNNILPELGQVIAHDFERFEITWMDILVGYAKVLDRLLDVLSSPHPAEEEAVKVIEEFLASRQKPYGEWKSPDWLEFMLRRIVEEARKPKPEKPLAEDELLF
jgi:hypothetical protein